MARYSFLCTCGIEQEIIMPMGSATFEDRPCRCGGVAQHQISAPAILTGNATFHKTPVDVVVGKDAERRWADINKRQGMRDKVRHESGKVGLSAVGRNEFAPATPENQNNRKRATDALQNQS